MRRVWMFLLVAVLSIVGLAEIDLEILTNRVDLLEDYVNMVYESLGERVTYEELEFATQDLRNEIKSFKSIVEEILKRLEVIGTELKIQQDGVSNISKMINDLSNTVNNLSVKLTTVDYLLTKKVTVLEEKIPLLASSKDLEALSKEVSNLKTENSLFTSKLNSIDESIKKLYEMASQRVKYEEMEVALDVLFEKMNKEVTEVKNLLEILDIKSNMFDDDIVKIFEIISTKVENEDFEELSEIVTKLSTDLNDLTEILNGLATQVGDMDYIIGKRIDSLDEKIEEVKVSIEVQLTERDKKFEQEIALRDKQIEELKVFFENKLKEKDEQIEEMKKSFEAQLVEKDKRIEQAEKKMADIILEYTNVVYKALNDRVTHEELQKALDNLKAEKDEVIKQLEQKLAESDKEIAELSNITILGVLIGIIGIGFGVWTFMSN